MFSQLASDLSSFMSELTKEGGFVEGASKIKPEMMVGVKTLAETILILTAANILDGLTKWISGGSANLSSFGEQLPDLGKNINDFATNLGTFDETKVATVQCAADAIKILAQASKEIPNEGGWLAGILGDNDIGTFGAKLPVLGYYINQFANNLGTFDETKVQTVGCAADAIKKIAEAASDIPNEGGWLAALVGDNDLTVFGAKLPLLGYYLDKFATNLGTFDETKVATVQCAADAIVKMAEAAEHIDGQADWTKTLFGDNSLSAFGGQLESLGTNIKNFAGNLGSFDESKVTSV
jgi:hypothetical protein